MDVILQAADALAASSANIARECAILKIERRLDELNSKMEIILSLLKAQKTQNMQKRQKTQNNKSLETKTRSVIKLASREISNLSTTSSRSTKRTSKTSSAASASSLSLSSSFLKRTRAQSMPRIKTTKTKDYYDKYPEIKKKFWGVGRGRRSLSIFEKMDELIAQLK